MGIDFSEEAGDVPFHVSPVSPGTDSVDTNPAVIAPASDGIGVDVQHSGYIIDVQHAFHFGFAYYILSNHAIS